MTKELESRNFFGVSEETYWRELSLSLAFHERVYCEVLGCLSMEVLEDTGSFETGLRRRLRFKKPIDAPAVITKVFGSTVDLEEHSSFDPTTRVWQYRMVPAIMADRLDITGSLRLEPAAGGVTQVSVNRAACRLFGIGGIVEHFVTKTTAESLSDKARFTERYIAEKKLV